MNYFGMIFCFMIPGMIIGGMAVALVSAYRRDRTENPVKERKALPENWFEMRVG